MSDIEDVKIVYSGEAVHYGDNKIVKNYFDSRHTDNANEPFTNKKLIVPFTKSDANGAQGDTYVPREDLLAKIDECFRLQTRKKRIAFLSGIGGCGKSELARAYGEIHTADYDDIFWLTCKDGTKPELIQLFAEADTLREVKKKDIDGFSDKVLIIIDNCNCDDGRFLFELEKATGDADILVTTRLNRMGSYENRMIQVESDDERGFAYRVFEKNYCKKPRRGIEKKIAVSEKESVFEICREVQYNTMVTALLGIRLREYTDLSISDCAKRIEGGVSKIREKIKYSKDQNSCEEEIKEILYFLFSDILSHRFTDAEKIILTILSLTPANWYEIDYVIALCKGAQKGAIYEYAVTTLRDLGWLQGDGERMAIHPLIAEVLSDKEIVIKIPTLFEGLLENYLGLPDLYLKVNRFLVNKILNSGKEAYPRIRLAVMTLINHGGYKRLFSELMPWTKVACIAYVNQNEKRIFVIYDLKKKRTKQLCVVPSQVKEGGQTELLKIFNKGVSYKFDLESFCNEKDIKEIPPGLFFRDSLLKGCVIPGNTVTIGDSAFEGCDGLIGQLLLPDGLTTIGNKAFADCRGLNGELCLPESITSIGAEAFRKCVRLSSVKLPESMKEIGDSIFIGCSGINGELHLPKGLTSIGQGAFMSCSGLSGELYLPENLMNIGKFAFCNCSGLTGELHFPEKLENIGACAFEYCTEVSGELHLPSRLTNIENSAFRGCSSLSGELHLPQSVTSIGKFAFCDCSGLSGKLNLPKLLTSIGSFAFSGCSGLNELNLPESLTIIEDYAFNDCSGLSGVNLPESLTSIGESAFSKCSGLSSLGLPKSLTSIGKSAFFGCSNLRELNLPESITSIGESAFCYCSRLSKLDLPKSLTHIEEHTFSSCSGLSKLNLPKSLTRIGKSAFRDCSGLRDLKLPESITIIEDYAFYSCIGLKGELYLPDSLISIGESAFSYCEGLSGDLNLPKSLTYIGRAAFYGCNGIRGKLSIPENLTEKEEDEFRYYIGLTYRFPHMEDDFSEYDKLLFCINSKGELVVPEGMTSIRCPFTWPKNMNSVSLPEGLLSIEELTFSNCDNLSCNLHLPDSLLNIGKYAFFNCHKLTGELRLPVMMSSIGEAAFYGCSGFSGGLRLPENLLNVEKAVFMDCSGLDGKLNLPRGLRSIGDNAFAYCYKLTGELYLPDDLESIGEHAFSYCSSLSGEPHMPKNLISIGRGAFEGCSGLRGELRLPESLTRIEDGAFDKCDSIDKIVFYNRRTEIIGVMNPYSSAIICGYKNSTAEEYAERQGLVFEELKEMTDSSTNVSNIHSMCFNSFMSIIKKIVLGLKRNWRRTQ